MGLWTEDGLALLRIPLTHLFALYLGLGSPNMWGATYQMHIKHRMPRNGTPAFEDSR